MRILIVEPSLSGHRGPYLKWIIEAFSELGHAVVLSTLKTEKAHPLFSGIRELVEAIHWFPDSTFVTLGSSRQNFRDMWRNMYDFRRVCVNEYECIKEQYSIDLVVVPYFDYMTYSVAILGSPFGSTPWTGIVMRPSFHHVRMGIVAPSSLTNPVKATLFRRLLRNKRLKALFTIDESLKDFIDATDGPEGTKLHFLPDPVSEPPANRDDTYRSVIGIPNECFLIVLYGAITLRKGIVELTNSMANDECPHNVHVLLAGEQDKSVVEALQSNGASRLRAAGRLHMVNRYIGPGDEDRVLGIADAVWVGYRGHYQMSAALVHAGLRGLPVIGCSNGLIGWHVSRRQCGLAVAIEDQRSILDAIIRLYRSRALCQELGRGGRNAFRNHTVSCAKKILIGALTDDCK